MTVKNISALIGVVLVGGVVIAVSGGHVGNRVNAAAAPRITRVTAREAQPAPLENKRYSVEPVGLRNRTMTNVAREPIVPSRDAGTTAPTGEIC